MAHWRQTKLPKWHLLTVKEVDLLTGLAIGRLSGYHKKFKLSGDWIKNEMSTTWKTTTKTLRDHQKKKMNDDDE